ncbi:MAG: ComEC/Rec2 family competence protein, partial [Dokdonella sp.]
MVERNRFARLIQRPAGLLQLPSLTPSRAAAALAGAVAVQGLSSLVHTGLAAGLLIAGLVAIFIRGADRAPLWFLLGFAWTSLHADSALQQRLAADWHGRDFLVSGVVSDLPEVVAGSTRFELDIGIAQLDGATVDLSGPVRLSWYLDAPPIEPCSRWTLLLRLRPPRGLVNPAGFDAERHAV